MADTPAFIRLRITTPRVAIGERMKKGTFRPCVETLPTSTLMGCFREHFGFEQTVAIGFFRAGSYRKEIFSYAPLDTSLGLAKLPLTLECLIPAAGQREIEGEVYVAATDEAKKVFAPDKGSWLVGLGALRSRGFGYCTLDYRNEISPSRRTGYLRGRLRETDGEAFGIDVHRDLIRPCYSFLFRPDPLHVGGQYERALIEGTILTGPDFLIGEDYSHDR